MTASSPRFVRSLGAQAYYNEIDPNAALILRALIADGVIAPGDVDTRSIKEVMPDDLRGYTQCHFFAGGGLWSVAARMAGWPDERPIWTGSCPCQPFSIAGKGGGIDDARHLWPDLFRLVSACRPPVIVGEQVAGAAGYGWFDGVRADLAGEGFAGRCVDIPACAVDAPHIRQRLYWVAVADADGRGRDGRPKDEIGQAVERIAAQRPDDFADHNLEHAARVRRGEGQPEPELRSGWATAAGADASGGQLADAGSGSIRDGGRSSAVGEASPLCGEVWEQRIRPDGRTDDDCRGRNGSWWAGHEWIACHDGKARRTQPGVPLLVDGLPGRVGLWRVAGNAISPVLAAEVIGALKDDLDERIVA